MKPLLFGVITEPWQVYVAGGVIVLGSAVGLYRAVLRANRAEKRKAGEAQEMVEAR